MVHGSAKHVGNDIFAFACLLTAIRPAISLLN
jgi:hypothetical protein